MLRRLATVYAVQKKQWLLNRSLRAFQRSHRPPAGSLRRPPPHSLALVVPCYGHRPYLESTLASIARQSYRPFEVIFVDDHSPDASHSFLTRACKELPEGILGTLLRTPRNLGQAAAINLAIHNTRAAVVTILNDDDYLMHDALEAAVALLQRHPQIYLLGAGATVFSGPGDPGGDPAARWIRSRCPSYGALPLTHYQPADMAHVRHPNDINMTHSGSSFFRVAWEAVGGYDSDKRRRLVMGSDRDFQLRVASLFPIALASTVAFAFWRSNSSVDRGKDS